MFLAGSWSEISARLLPGLITWEPSAWLVPKFQTPRGRAGVHHKPVKINERKLHPSGAGKLEGGSPPLNRNYRKNFQSQMQQKNPPWERITSEGPNRERYILHLLQEIGHLCNVADGKPSSPRTHAFLQRTSVQNNLFQLPPSSP